MYYYDLIIQLPKNYFTKMTYMWINVNIIYRFYVN